MHVIRDFLVGLLALFFSAASIAAVAFYAFTKGHPDGELRSPVLPFLLPAIAIYLFLTVFGALFVANASHGPGPASRGSSVFISFIAAIPYLLLSISSGLPWLVIALSTFGTYYGIHRLPPARA
jgi:hypothetical protein